MKREFITEEEAKKQGLIYTGICYCVPITAKEKKEVINLAAREEEESGIPCYPVMGEGNMTVYAEPLYLKRREYYINANSAKYARDDLIKVSITFQDALNKYLQYEAEVGRLGRELTEAGVKI